MANWDQLTILKLYMSLLDERKQLGQELATCTAEMILCQMAMEEGRRMQFAVEEKLRNIELKIQELQRKLSELPEEVLPETERKS